MIRPFRPQSAMREFPNASRGLSDNSGLGPKAAQVHQQHEPHPGAVAEALDGPRATF